MLQQTKDITYQQKTFFWGEVAEIEDNTLSGRIKVRVPHLDKNIKTKDLPPCYPMGNFQFFSVLPKVGERVLVFPDRIYAEGTLNQEKRYWLGIGISQPHTIDYDPNWFTADSNEADGYVRPLLISQIPTARGLNPKQGEMAIRGRVNTDILFGDSQLLLRAGRHEKASPLVYNDVDPAYVQIKHSETIPEGTNVRLVEELRDVPTQYLIRVKTFETSATVTVVEKETNTTKETFSETFSNRNRMFSVLRETILAYQGSYPQWELRTSDEELSDMPVVFPNNKVVIKKQVVDKSQSQSLPSMVNIVADRINLLSHLTNDYDLSDPDSVISTEDTKRILENTSEIPKGDVLLSILELMRSVILNHVHPYPNMPIVGDTEVQRLASIDFSQMLNPNIRIG